ncbi:helix-turn-helix domain-containing protein [Streptomyces rubellomurinus]|uniref:helix-turn-helix domain-containing protein n=1 Tax=Streptomyces rubellomurinus (strain ATCC 31215) TaxID=359131 RepID=UPI0012FE9753|nr:helix-turn-helix domain-containing protein [Streptomyces rubellomurinus]
MTSTVDLLSGMLGENAYAALEALAGATVPPSGRMLAQDLGISPTTATAALERLREAGFATSSKVGRANRWHLTTDNETLRAWLEETRSDAAADVAAGVSPYATGGGGVTFERKVAVQYLAHLLLGTGATELGDSRTVVGVEFQRAPEHSADDLVIRAARADEVEPSLVLALAVRRAPDLVQSNEASRKLIGTLVQEVVNTPTGGPEYRAGLVVAGRQEHTEQLALLAAEAFVHKDAPSFFGLIRTHRKFPAGVRTRLRHLEGLVKLALPELGTAAPDSRLVEQRTWELLSRLTVLMPRLETPDELDWGPMTNSLILKARGTDLYGAMRLQERLVALAAEYAPKAASVDLGLLRRHCHEVLDSATRRHQPGWAMLARLHQSAVASVSDAISGDGRKVHLERRDTADQLLQVVQSSAAAVVVRGDSGVGKSALAVRTIADAALDPDVLQALCIDLRSLPGTGVELESALRTSLATLLGELSAPQRLLLIDGADALVEGKASVFFYLVDAAVQADVKVVAVTANDAQQVVHDTLSDRVGGDIASFEVPSLTDAQVAEVTAVFSELSALAEQPRSRELLRRPVVVDLLVRGRVTATPLNDADAMHQVWNGLVLRKAHPERGLPEARSITLLRLAALELGLGDALDVMGTIDATALAGLRQDGLLRTDPDDPFTIGPRFAHDEVRRYAIARLLLTTASPTARLLEAGVPRWTLGAARLASQAFLAQPNSPRNPLRGRFTGLQDAFDRLVTEGHGDRWGDVPGEALLTLGAPDPVLRDAWPTLRAEPDTGMRRLLRLVDQRLRNGAGLVRIDAVEPLIALLLEGEEPWQQGKHVQGALRDWLHAVTLAGTPAGYPLRVKLHDRLVAACAEADRRFHEQQAAAATAQAALPPEEVEAERQHLEKQRLLFMGRGRRRTPRPTRPEIPREIADDLLLELMALLGPDLGEDGEVLLRRVAHDAPAWVGPTVEEVLTGRALAMYRRGLLADLTEAYYLNEDEDGTGFHEDGIRHHTARGLGVTPLAAWYRGPFLALFQSDFRNGVAVLNRMLNHAALTRARTLASSHLQYGSQVEEHDLNAFRTRLDVAGERRTYIGDEHVWHWYRGTGVGPYPCMSALQALERICDQLIEANTSLERIIAILLEGCENLAMVGLIVSLLVRHLERADRLLDRYLTEPDIWHLEFGRVVSEAGGLGAAPSDGLTAPERRRWSLREAAMTMVLHANDQRAEELRLVGQELIATARRMVEEELGETDDQVIQDELTAVRGWASSLDRSTYQAQRVEGGVEIQSTPPSDVVEALQAKNVESARAHEAMRLNVRYYVNPKNGNTETLTAQDLIADLAAACDLLENPPDPDSSSQWDAPAAVAAAALTAHVINGVDLPVDSLLFAADTLLRIGQGAGSPRPFEFEETYFEQGADRHAARALPLLLLPGAARLRAQLDGKDGSATYYQTASAAGKLGNAVANEVRVHLARGLDQLWRTNCTTDDSVCHHETAFELAVETMRDCVLGEWDPQTGRRKPATLDDPIARSLAEVTADSIHEARLDGAIRALGPAAAAQTCVSDRARELLNTVLATQRRSLLASENDRDHRGTRALIAARALLSLASTGEDAPVIQHIDAYADHGTRLGSFLSALAAAAEESADAGAVARRMWPAVITHVMDLQADGHSPFMGRRDYGSALASLLPNSAAEVTYLYREVQGEPIIWWDPLAWRDAVARWLPITQGSAACVDQLIGFIRPLPAEDQARVGLPWVADLVLAHPGKAARTYLLASWLIELRQTVADVGMTEDWQRVVDALVVAGLSRLAPYSE